MTKTSEQSVVPKFPVADLTRLDEVFPASVLKIMPKYEDIPEEFRNFSPNNKWARLFSDMFYSGLAELELTPHEGIDKDKAWRHLRTIAGSFEPKHEHKEAAFAYLASQWFKDVTWKRAEKGRAR